MRHHPDDRLDAVLDPWAAGQRLDARQAGDLLHAILQEPRESLPVTWWTDLAFHVTAAVVRASAGPTVGSARMGVAVGAAG